MTTALVIPGGAGGLAGATASHPRPADDWSVPAGSRPALQPEVQHRSARGVPVQPVAGGVPLHPVEVAGPVVPLDPVQGDVQLVIARPAQRAVRDAVVGPQRPGGLGGPGAPRIPVPGVRPGGPALPDGDPLRADGRGGPAELLVDDGVVAAEAAGAVASRAASPRAGMAARASRRRQRVMVLVSLLMGVHLDSVLGGAVLPVR